MKTFGRKRALCLCAALICLVSLGLTPISAQSAEKSGVTAAYTAVSAENDSYSLAVSEEDGCVTLTDRRTGQVQRSWPEQTAEDGSMKRSARMQVRSALHVEVLDRENNAKTTLYSLPDAVNQEGLTVHRTEKEWVAEYRFPDAGLTVPVHYTLDGERFLVSVLPQEIREEGDVQLMSLTLHPYFFCGTADETGYLLVPDGSGALIRFPGQNYAAGAYKQKVYGVDLANYRYSEVEKAYAVRMPVFGIGRAGVMALGIVTGGAGDAYIEANPGTSHISYSGAWASFTLMGQDVRAYTTDNRADMDVYPEKRNGVSLLQVTYLLKSSEKTDYAAMAGLLREYLAETCGLTRVTDETYPLYLDITAATQRKKSFLGIAYTGTQTLTTFSEAEAIVRELQESGAAVTVRLNNWSSQTVTGAPLTGSTPLRRAGGKAGLLSLKAAVEKTGTLYVSGHLSAVYRPGLFDRFFRLAENMQGAVIDCPTFDLATNMRLDKTYHLLKTDRIVPTAAAFADSLRACGLTAVSAGGVETMYTDYSSDTGCMTATAEAYASAVRTLSEAGLRVAADGGYMDTLAHAAMVWNLPAGDSRFAVCDEAVPFFAIALHGYVPFALEPVNTSAEPRRALLTALETGSGLTFGLIHADAEATRYSRDDRLYAAQAERWMDTIKSAYAEYAAFMQGKQALCIRDHAVLAEGVRRTVYEDGSYVIVNYGDTPYTADGVTVSPLSYVTGKEAH